MPKKAAPRPTAQKLVPKKERISQSDIPAYSLEEALKIPRAIADNYNLKPTTPLSVASALEVQPNTGSFRMVTGAAIAYGLTTGGAQSTQIELTPLSIRIVQPKVEGDDLVAKREAFLTPRVIGEFLRRYDTGAVPRRDIAMNVLSGDFGVPAQRTGAVFEMIMEGARSLGFVKTIKEKEYIALEGAGETAAAHAEEQTYDASEQPEPLEEAKENAATNGPQPAAPALPTPAAPVVAETNKRIFITHGKNKELLDPIKKMIQYGKYEPVVAEEKQSVSKPVPDKVMGTMRSCGAAIIHVDVEQAITDEKKVEHIILNPNVLIEIGAAMALYGRRFILLVQEGVKLPSNLQGLYEVRYNGEKLDSDVTLKLLDAIQDIQNNQLPDRYRTDN
jgi:predicted nucleotide-binding protein